MSWNSTLVTVVGTVAGTVSYKHGEDGRSNAFFRLSSTERRYNTALGDWEDGETLWLGVSCWRKLADSVKTTLSQGDPVIVQGKLRLRHYEKDDAKKIALNLDALHVGLDLTRVQSLGVAPVVEPRVGEEPVAHTAPF
ncbi:single-stranded DNA-binding protein [Lentzea sp. NPDC059081]|uniref:single-stranded DNA-binding protein n=1 Tax=Lentzea sp. NPDC059081 TaxID=3346719 RepID=UPI0036A63D27